jgi:hypothetical protein
MNPQRWSENPVTLAVIIVGGLTFSLILGVLILIGMERDVPDWFSALMGSGMGSLATLLVSRQNVPPEPPTSLMPKGDL